MNYNIMTEKLNTLIKKHIAPANQAQAKYEILSLIDQIFNFQVVTQSPSTLIIKSPSYTSKLVSMSALMRDWELESEEDEILRYTKRGSNGKKEKDLSNKSKTTRTKQPTRRR